MPTGTETPLGKINVKSIWSLLGGQISNAEKQRRRSNALRAAAQRQSSRLAIQRRVSPPKPPPRSPSPPKPRSPSPPKSRTSPSKPQTIKVAAQMAYNNAYNKALQKTKTNNWQAKARSAANLIIAAGGGYGLSGKKWVNAYAHILANHAGMTAHNAKYKMSGRVRPSLPGSYNYIHHNNPLYSNVRKALKKLNL